MAEKKSKKVKAEESAPKATPQKTTLTEAELAAKIVPLIGGVTNVVEANNCMTRLRLTVKDPSQVKINEVKKLPGVLGTINDGALVQIVLGPGKVRKVTEEFNQLVEAAKSIGQEFHRLEDATHKQNAETPITGNAFVRFFKHIGRGFKRIRWKRGLRHIGNVFSPLVPGFIVFGICYSLTVIIQVAASGGSGAIVPVDQLTGVAAGFYWFFYAIAFGFLAYLSVLVGSNAAKEFGATPTIGAMLGGLAIVPEIINLAVIIGWADDLSDPLALIASGRGGVFTVILTVFIISYIEKAIRKKMPNVLDTVFSPLFTIVIGAALLLFAIMPAMGFVSNGITWLIDGFQNLNPGLRAVGGFFMAGLFLPLVMLGLHHGLTTIYVTLGSNNILYPVFSMADAAQCGVGIAIYLKARKYKHDRLRENAAAGIIPQALGVSEPLIYGVTLPLFKPFITVGIGAAIGGAFIAGMGLGFNGFDVSGLLGLLLAGNLNGVGSPVMARVVFLCGWLMAAGGGFISTWLMINEKDLERLPRYDTFINKVA